MQIFFYVSISPILIVKISIDASIYLSGIAFISFLQKTVLLYLFCKKLNISVTENVPCLFVNIISLLNQMNAMNRYFYYFPLELIGKNI